MITFEDIPQELVSVKEEVLRISEKLDRIVNNQPANEVPIDSRELKRRLNISEPTLVRLRKRGTLPYMRVGGVVRYDWLAVQKALTK